MKLAFTTLGCPKWNMDTIISKAVKYGFDGVDFRGYLGELNVYGLPEFTTEIKDTAKRFDDAGLEVPCFSSSVHVFSRTSKELNASIEEVRAYAELCAHFQTPFIRVFGGSIGNTPRAEAINITVANIEHMTVVAKKYDIQLLIETHGAWIDSHHLSAVMERVNSESAGVLWDTHHPYRTLGETYTKTWEVLGKWIRYTHWKDSYVKPDTKRGYQLCLVGDGDIPLKDIFACLKSNNYDGYLTLEWEKLWCPEIEEPETAFPRYVRVMRELMQPK